MSLKAMVNTARAKLGAWIYPTYDIEPPYNATSFTRRALKNWNARTTSANTELSDGERKTLIARAYDSNRNDTIARAAIGRVKTHVAGVGLKFVPTIDSEFLGITEAQAEELEETIEREFGFWQENCDARRSFDFEQMQALIIATCLISGDCFVNTTFRERAGDLYGLKLQVIDSERVSNPNCTPDRAGKLIKGVEFDNGGAPSGYWVRKSHPADSLLLDSKIYEWSKYMAFGRLSGRRRLLHVHEIERPEGARGVSYLAPVLEPLKKLNLYWNNELTATILANALTFFIESEGEEENLGFKDKEENEEGDEEFEIGEGAVVELKRGKKVNPVVPVRPNTAFEAFISTVSRPIAAALEMPLDEVLLMFNTSYSAARAAMLKAWLFYRSRRQLLSKMLCYPTYRLWFDEAVARGILPHIRRYSDPRRRLMYQSGFWHGPGRGAIDELKEAQSAGKRLELLISSPQIEAVNITGESLRTLVKQNKRAKRLFARAGLLPETGTKVKKISKEGKEKFLEKPKNQNNGDRVPPGDGGEGEGGAGEDRDGGAPGKDREALLQRRF